MGADAPSRLILPRFPLKPGERWSQPGIARGGEKIRMAAALANCRAVQPSFPFPPEYTAAER